MLPYVFDLIIIVLLVIFAWMGAKKGLILTLFGLAAFFVAFFGARFLSEQLYQPVSELIQPAVYDTIVELGQGGAPADSATAQAAFSLSGETDFSQTVEELLDILREADLFTGFVDLVEQAIHSDLLQPGGAQQAVMALSEYLAQLIAKAVIFAVSFLLILLVWFLISRLLDLTFRLPILSAVNFAGGLVLGVAQGAVLVVVLVWLGQLAGVVPAEPDTPVLSLFTLRRLNELILQLTA